MKILIISPGKAHDRAVADAVASFEKRLEKQFDLVWMLPAADDTIGEAKNILKAVKDTDFVVLLDERGKDIDTPGFAALLDSHLQGGTKRLVFVIGGAFGVDKSVRERADKTLRLSSLVFPHMLVRLILIEQIYRAQTILKGGAYHHA